MRTWWLSSTKMTILVVTDKDLVIVDAAPVVRKFIGQPAKNLADWMRKQGGFLCQELKNDRLD
jgi:hypothetical protein